MGVDGYDVQQSITKNEQKDKSVRLLRIFREFHIFREDEELKFGVFQGTCKPSSFLLAVISALLYQMLLRAEDLAIR